MVKQLTFAAGAGLLGLLLLVRLADGTAGYLVQSWYRPILLVSGLLLLGMAALSVVLALRSGQKLARPTSTDAVMALLVGLPLALGFGFRPEPLAGGSLDSRDQARQFSASAASNDPALRNIYQWAYEFQTASLAELTGAPVEVIGFVYHPDEAAEGEFDIARFVVACCVADAQGFTLPVLWKDADRLPADTWVKVTGRVTAGSNGSPAIQATEIQQIEAPSNPYIYP